MRFFYLVVVVLAVVAAFAGGVVFSEVFALAEDFAVRRGVVVWAGGHDFGYRVGRAFGSEGVDEASGPPLDFVDDSVDDGLRLGEGSSRRRAG